MRRSGITTPEIWDQFDMMLNSIYAEKMERAMALNTKDAKHSSSVVISTDPLDEEIEQEVKPTQNKGFNPIT